MKKEAQNLAFDVAHKNKPFEVALVEAAEMNAAVDFLTTLNSMSKNTIYSVNDVDALVEDARAKIQADQQKDPTVDDLKNVIKKFTSQREQMEALIEKLKAQLKVVEDQHPTAKSEPRKVNTYMVMGLLIGIGAVLVLFSLQMIFPALIVLFGITIACVVMFSGEKDTKRTKELEKIVKKKNELKKKIREVREKIEGLNIHIKEQEELISHLGSGGGDESSVE